MMTSLIKIVFVFDRNTGVKKKNKQAKKKKQSAKPMLASASLYILATPMQTDKTSWARE